MNSSKKTSWGKVAAWYDDHLETDTDSYHAKVILPNLVRLVHPAKGMRLLDLACGQGFFTREFARAGAQVEGADIARELIAFAREHSDKKITYHVASADALTFAKRAQYDTVVCVLALQNIENLAGTIKEVRRVLKPGGHFVCAVNHPAFRVLKRSSWGWDDTAHVQYRRIDGYLTGAKIAVEMQPGQTRSKKTISYHRSLQDFAKALTNNGFVISKLEEWTSHKKSAPGPRQKAEDTARKEIPLFMAIEAK